MLDLFFDGACEPFNPGGTASCGFVIKKDGKIIVQGSKIVGKGDGMTNNVAEYHGLIEGIKAFSRLNIDEKIIIHGDSSMVCNMVSKTWGWNNKKTKWIGHKDNVPHLKLLLEEVLNLLEKVNYEIIWIPREENQEADDLSKEPLVLSGIIKNEDKPKGEMCPDCGGFLKKISGKFGDFYGCSNYPKCHFIKKADKKEIKTLDIKPKIKKKREEGDFCPKNCGGTLYWKSSKLTEKRLKKAYHYEKLLKCDKCGAIFLDDKYKVMHNKLPKDALL